MKRPSRNEILTRCSCSLILVMFLCVPSFCQTVDPESTPVGESSVKSDPAAVAPQTASEVATQPRASGRSEFAFPLIKSVGGFGIVISLIVGGFVLARKYAPHYFAKRTAQRMLRVVETLPMGEKRSISVVEVGEKRYLLGNTAQQITLLAPLDRSFSLSPAESAESGNAGKPEPFHRDKGSFRTVLEGERKQLMRNPGTAKILPAEIRAKMRELRDGLQG